MDFETFREIVGSIAGMAALIGFLAFAVWNVWRFVSGRNRGSTGDDSDDDDLLGHCSECGYDLRGSPDRCPECGTSIAEMRARRANTELDPHALRDNWPAVDVAIRWPDAHEFPVVIHETTNALEAELLVAQLEARGVQAGIRIKEESLWVGRGYETISYRLVMVPSDDEKRARSIVDGFRWNRPSKTAAPV